MEICKACVNAQTNPDSGLINAECEKCNARDLAKCPKFIRTHYFEMVEKNEGKTRKEEVEKMVLEEYKRMKRLREKQSCG